MVTRTIDVAPLRSLSLHSATREPPSNHTARDSAGQVARVQCTAGEVRGLAELVAAREGEAVGDGEDEGDCYCRDRPCQQRITCRGDGRKGVSVSAHLRAAAR